MLLIKVFEVDVLEVLWQLAIYAMIDMPETRKRTKINKTDQKIVDYQ
jgi:hypothetical protein